MEIQLRMLVHCVGAIRISMMTNNRARFFFFFTFGKCNKNGNFPFVC